ncbi:MAG: NHL repeat-containing protein [Kiritimatiellia bacterium]
MKTSGWKVIFTGALLLSGLVSAQAQRMPQDSWAPSRSWGGAGSGEGQFSTLRCVAVGPEGRIYATDFGNDRVQVFEPDGTFVRQWGDLMDPWAITVARDGLVYVSENTGYRIHVFNPDGTTVRTWGSNGSGDGQFSVPKGVALAPDGRVWVADSGNHRIQIFESDGTFVRAFGSAGSLSGQFNLPRGISIAPDGTAYVADTGNNRIQAFAADGTFLRSWAHSAPWDVSISPDGLAYVAHTGVKVYELDGTYLHVWSNSCSGVAAQMNGGVVVAGYTNNDVLVFDRIYRTPGGGSAVPLPVVLSCEQRAGTPFLDIDYAILDADSPTVSVAVAAFEGGTNSLDHYVHVRTLLDGTEANVGTNVPANATNRISWNVAADWQADYVNLKARVMANDGRGLLDVGFITLPAEGPDAALTISASPLTQVDLLPVWVWLLATSDAAVNLSTGKVYGVGGAYEGQLLAQGTNTTDAGRAYLFDRIGVREALAAEVARARTGSSGVTNQWVPRFTAGPGDRPKKVNEYGFDTGDWGASAWWVVKE